MVKGISHRNPSHPIAHTSPTYYCRLPSTIGRCSLSLSLSFSLSFFLLPVACLLLPFVGFFSFFFRFLFYCTSPSLSCIIIIEYGNLHTYLVTVEVGKVSV